MTDTTNNWTGGDAARQEEDPTKPARRTSDLVVDSGERTPPSAVAGSTSEKRTFDRTAETPESTPHQPESGSSPGLSAKEQESLLRASLETIRVKADELRGQAKDWTQVRGEQARHAIDERPITAVAAAFGAGLVLGALLSR